MIPFKHAVIPDGKNSSIITPPHLTQAVIEELAKNFVVRDDDLFIVSYPKSGTHWMKQIVHLLANNGQQGEQIIEATIPFLDVEAAGLGNFSWKKFEKMSGRRYFHSHLPYTLMPGVNDSQAKYIYVARNPKDCAVSYYHFAKKYQRMAFKGTWDEFFSLYIKGDVQYGLVFEHVVAWWQASQRAEHILFVKYEEMHKNLPDIVAQVASFINIPLTPKLQKAVLKQSAFTSMVTNPKANGQWIPQQEGFSLLRKGIVGDWRHHFTAAQNEIFENLYREKVASAGLTFDFDPNNDH